MVAADASGRLLTKRYCIVTVNTTAHTLSAETSSGALFALLPWNVDPEIAEKMRTGSVAYELLRPLDLYAFWLGK